jgi:hypothetical protein
MRKKIQLLKKKIHEYHEEKSKQDQKIIKLSVENENLVTFFFKYISSERKNDIFK